MSKEIKVALLAIVAIALLIFGYNFLKGSNIFSSDRTFYATYPSATGLTAGTVVVLNGVPVGQVNSVKLQPEKNNMVHIGLEIRKDIAVGDSSVATIVGSLLGSKTISLKLGKSTKLYTGGEELKAVSDVNIADIFQARALPVLDTVGATLGNLNAMLNKDAQTNIAGTLLGARQSAEALQALIVANQANIAAITGNMAKLTRSLNNTSAKLDKIVVNFDELSDSLKSAPVGPALRRLNSTLAETQGAMAGLNKSLNDPNGSLNKLLNDSSLYVNLNTTVTTANSLFTDINDNPRRYVHFSVFGGTKDKEKTEVTKKPDGTVIKEEKKVEKR
ncbi:MlaD family protein [Hymenobacter sp. ASUV-10]|uniref:MlaD family protein n=1 Tax=Hymenobacter aranciens TaxID=3063996 RepID=A0ABT9BJ65_9BACT|nr:MlaD family protein [Hymenobacter sp. ASUV-10]MDO7876568.1 MlaD family protein [Hymenobacter sp. ASUV-10]